MREKTNFPPTTSPTTDTPKDTNKMTTTVQQLAQSALFQFTTATRDNGITFVKTTDNCPRWVKDLVFTAHNGMSPDDYKYSMIQDALQTLTEYDDTESALDDVEPEYSYYNLLQWLASNTSRVEYSDRYYEEFGGNDAKLENSLMKQIEYGNWMEKYEVMQSVTAYLQEIIA